ncbi:MAG: YeeE/YedE family protein [Alphaproteobacteria bacterium]|nr:YeeE/YedE family protein [Alphaproteobacteria bacterium]
MNSFVQTIGRLRFAARRREGANLGAGVVGIGALILGVGLIYDAFDWRQAALYGIGGALGVVLYHAAFGFTSAWRAFLTDGRGAGLRAQMLMLAVASVLFLPALSEGSFFGRAIVGAVAPLSVSLIVGAFMFGIGMQLGGACASGTLFTAGGGSTRMWITLAAFIAGSVIATFHVPWWFSQPGYSSYSLLIHLGLGGALGIQGLAFIAVIGLTIAIERRRHGRLVGSEKEADAGGWRRIVRGPWPLLWGAVGLAVLNFTTLGVAGHPWGITYGFTLWGAKIAQAMGVDVSSWTFWTWGYHKNALASSIFANSTSVMNFGILAGAVLAAGLARKFAPVAVWRLPWRSVAAAVIGGLLMGYGARLAFGCNIGAFFGGIASASVHGWVWFGVAMAGTVLGTWMRPLFGLDGFSARSPR